jgi:hypothetical protein
MKQKDIPPLPGAARASAPQLPPEAAADEAKAPAAKHPAPAEAIGANGPDLPAPSSEHIRASSGAAMKKAMLDLLCDNAEVNAVLDEKEDENPKTADVRPKRRPKTRGLPWWRLPERLLPDRPAPDMEFFTSEPVSIASLVIASEWPWPDHPGKRLKGKSDATAGERKHPGLGDDEMVAESGDRLNRVAVVAHTVNQESQTPKQGRLSTLVALKPKSKAECERRCGSDGFCDPSSVFGCGGVHCGRRHDIVD